MVAVETKRIELAAGAAPVNLTADPDLELRDDGLERRVGFFAIQNVSTRIARYSEEATAPAGTATNVGHTLSGGDGVIIQLVSDRPFWFWSASGATLAVSAAAPQPSDRWIG